MTSYTVVEVCPKTSEIVRKLYTDARLGGCLTVIDELTDKCKWDVERLSVVNNKTGRHVSFALL